MKISLTAQLAEVDRELAMRRQVYPSQVARKKLRESHAKFQMQHLEAVRATLLWLQENETSIKAALGIARPETETE